MSRLGAQLCAAAAALAAGCGGGERLPAGDLPRAPAALRVSAAGFGDGARLPRRFTCDGAGAQPRVRARGVPAAARELVLVVADPDAPGGTYVHLTRYGMRPRAGGALAGGRAGANSAGGTGWTAPCPPKGDDPHRYVWSVYALRAPSGLRAGADPGDVLAALRRGVLAKGAITARYARR